MDYCITGNCLSGSIQTPAGQIFVQLMQSILSAQCAIADSSMYPVDRIREVLADPEFDFIVVGGGTAGSVVASRLSENEEWKVLLIERGKDPSITSRVPGLVLSLQHTPEDYSYKAEPDGRFCQGMKNGACVWAKGKVLGGSSSINGMLHMHGNDRDYDTWEKQGNYGWSFRDLLPYFRKMENYPPEVAAKLGPEYLGVSGPVKIRTFNYTRPLMADIITSAGEELGYPKMETFNTNKYIGFGTVHGAVDDGLRQDAARSFLSLAKNRKNLYVIKSTRADSVVIQNKKAVGVRVTLENGRKVRLRAKKEVILSAGAVASPQILMLSGIGPKKHLLDVGIKLVSDLPVGSNLQDHVGIFHMVYAYNNNTKTNYSASDQTYRYLIHKKGPLSSSPLSFTGFLNVDDFDAKYPNTQYHFGFIDRGDRMSIDSTAIAFNFGEDVRQQLNELNQYMDLTLVFPLVLNPKSAGKIRLRSRNPRDQVRIYPNYFDDKEDMDVLVKAINSFRAMENTKAFQMNNVTLKFVRVKGCEGMEEGSDEFWICQIRKLANTVYHPTSTAKMGPVGDETAVVDPELRVHGVANLRVIDTSIMPAVTSANTNGPTMMIAEKGSDMIKATWISEKRDNNDDGDIS